MDREIAMRVLTSVKRITVFTIMLIIVGCSNQTPQQQANQARIENLQEQKEEQLGITPEWYVSPPAPDSNGFYGVGYSQSKHLGHALKSAKLQAEFELAKMYKQELSGSERSYQQGNDGGDISAQTTFLIDKIVDAVPVVGYTVVEQKVIPVAGVYQAFVQLKLPYDEFNRVLQSQKAEETNKRVQLAFDDLERRLNNRRTQKEEGRALQHKRDLETMKVRAELLNQKAEAVKDDGVNNSSESKQN